MWYDEQQSHLHIISVKYHESKTKDHGIQTKDFKEALDSAHEIVWSNNFKNSYNNNIMNIINDNKHHSKKQCTVYYCYNDSCDDIKQHSQLCESYKKRNIIGEICDIFKLKEELNRLDKPEPVQYSCKLSAITSTNNDDIMSAILQNKIGDVDTYTFFITYNTFVKFIGGYQNKNDNFKHTIEEISENGEIDSLFDQNIRLYQGTQKNAVNKSISSTVTDQKKEHYLAY
jgi:hypothetical protein